MNVLASIHWNCRVGGASCCADLVFFMEMTVGGLSSCPVTIFDQDTRRRRNSGTHSGRREDLPRLSLPNKYQRNACVSLTLDLIDWIRSYEVNIVECLGIEYRRRTLIKWDNGERPFTPAEKFASAWRELSFQIAANFDAFSQEDAA